MSGTNARPAPPTSPAGGEPPAPTRAPTCAAAAEQRPGLLHSPPPAEPRLQRRVPVALGEAVLHHGRAALEAAAKHSSLGALLHQRQAAQQAVAALPRGGQSLVSQRLRALLRRARAGRRHDRASAPARGTLRLFSETVGDASVHSGSRCLSSTILAKTLAAPPPRSLRKPSVAALLSPEALGCSLGSLAAPPPGPSALSGKHPLLAQTLLASRPFLEFLDLSAGSLEGLQNVPPLALAPHSKWNQCEKQM